MTAGTALSDSGPLVSELPASVLVEPAWEEDEEVSVLDGEEAAEAVLVVEVTVLEVEVGWEVLEVAAGALVAEEALTGVVELPCEPPAAITAQANAKVEMLPAAT